MGLFGHPCLLLIVHVDPVVALCIHHQTCGGALWNLLLHSAKGLLGYYYSTPDLRWCTLPDLGPTLRTSILLRPDFLVQIARFPTKQSSGSARGKIDVAHVAIPSKICE